MKIYIVGLGPGNIDLISKKAYELLKDKSIKKIFRTSKHSIVEELLKEDIDFESMDFLYETSENFEEVYEKISNIVINSVKTHEKLIYAVPGSPFITEETTNIIINKAKAENIDIQIVPSVSFIDSAICSIRKDPTRNLYTTDFFNMDISRMHPTDNILISQVYDRFKASDLKLKLLEIYDDEQEVCVIRNSGNDDEQVERVKLFEMDYNNVKYDHLTSIFIESVKAPKFKGLSDIKYLTDNICDKNKMHEMEFLPTKSKNALKIISELIEINDYEKIEELLSEEIINLFLIISLLEKNEVYSLKDIENTVFYRLEDLKKKAKIE